MQFEGPSLIGMCIFNNKKHTHYSEMFALGEGYGDYVLMTHSHGAGGIFSDRMPGETWVFINLNWCGCVCVLPLAGHVE